MRARCYIARVKVVSTDLPGLFVIEPTVHADARGAFTETWRKDKFAEAGLVADFVQDNESVSKKGVLRGLHFQHPDGQLKLVRVSRGEVFDAVVDVRRGSPTFGKAFWTTLSAENHRQLWIPAGFAHGFLALTDDAVFHYKVTTHYAPASERGILWNDPALGIPWPATAAPLVSPKDVALPTLASCPADALPRA